MLTAITPLKIFRFPLRDLERHSFDDFNTDIVEWGYAGAVEVEAMLRGEDYHPAVIPTGFIHGHMTFNNSLTFVCSDGEYKWDVKATLARHFLYIREFLDEFPDVDRIDMRQHSRDDIRAVIENIMYMSIEVLTPERIYALQTLSPVTDLYYFFFTLISPQS